MQLSLEMRNAPFLKPAANQHVPADTSKTFDVSNVLHHKALRKECRLASPQWLNRRSQPDNTT
jgi:hypothetical protein